MHDRLEDEADLTFQQKKKPPSRDGMALFAYIGSSFRMFFNHNNTDNNTNILL
jgi:hypothetical protein